MPAPAGFRPISRSRAPSSPALVPEAIIDVPPPPKPTQPPEKVTDLRGWPIVGQSYFVPTLMAGQTWVPVWPEPHQDFEIEEPHFHIDPRFITEEQEASLTDNWQKFCEAVPEGQEEPYFHSAMPVALRMALNIGFTVSPGIGAHPRLQPMVCRYERVEWDMPPRDHWWEKRYFPNLPADPTLKAIEGEDGRPLCPHQRFDLSAVWDGESETVRCPFHGLLVDVSRCRKSLSTGETRARGDTGT